MTTIGIDVGAKDLVVSVRHKCKVQHTKTFSNNHPVCKQIIKLCKKYSKYGAVRVAMEATGAYYLDAAITLSEIENIDLIVANPRATKAFAQAIMERNKTDKVDSIMLALFAEKMDYPLWERPSDKAIQLRYFARMIHSFSVYKAKSSNHLHALQSFSNSPKELIEMINSEIEFFEKLMEKAKKEVIVIIQADLELKKSFELLQTIKGIGELSAIQILAEILLIPQGLSHKQWVAFAGLDPRHYQSGTSINKKPRISKAGNRYFRKALFMPALAAARNDTYVKQYFEHLVENRRLSKLQAITAIMRKLIHAIHGMLLRKKPFDNKRFFWLRENCLKT